MTRAAHPVLAGLIIVAATWLVACGAGSPPSGVASLAESNGSGGGKTTTTVSKQTAAQLYHDWAQCMRQHGVALPDPVINDQGGTQISIPQGASMQTFQTADSACRTLHAAAQAAARGGQPTEKPDPTKLLNFARCMRAHGVADFPDPSGGALRITTGPGSDLNPSNPTFLAAQKACQPIIGTPKGGEMVTAGVGPGGGPGSGSVSGGGPSGG